MKEITLAEFKMLVQDGRMIAFCLAPTLEMFWCDRVVFVGEAVWLESPRFTVKCQMNMACFSYVEAPVTFN